MTEWSNKTRDVVEAIADYTEKRIALAKAMDAYDGYSPSWALSNEISARDDAEKRVESALNAFVQDAVQRAVAHQRGSE